METFSALLASVNHKGQWRGASMFFMYTWINDWVNNREAGDLMRHCAHYDVIIKGIHTSSMLWWDTLAMLWNISVNPYVYSRYIVMRYCSRAVKYVSAPIRICVYTWQSIWFIMLLCSCHFNRMIVVDLYGHSRPSVILLNGKEGNTNDQEWRISFPYFDLPFKLQRG